jgi:hypothetical protein
MSEQELLDGLRQRAPHTELSYGNYYEELFRRSQDRHTREVRRWTRVIAVATVVNVVVALINSCATVYQVLRGAGWFQ